MVTHKQLDSKLYCLFTTNENDTRGVEYLDTVFDDKLNLRSNDELKSLFLDKDGRSLRLEVTLFFVQTALFHRNLFTLTQIKNSDTAKEVFKNIIQNWPSLSENTKKLVNRILCVHNHESLTKSKEATTVNSTTGYAKYDDITINDRLTGRVYELDNEYHKITEDDVLYPVIATHRSISTTEYILYSGFACMIPTIPFHSINFPKIVGNTYESKPIYLLAANKKYVHNATIIDANNNNNILYYLTGNYMPNTVKLADTKAHSNPMLYIYWSIYTAYYQIITSASIKVVNQFISSNVYMNSNHGYSDKNGTPININTMPNINVLNINTGPSPGSMMVHSTNIHVPVFGLFPVHRADEYNPTIQDIRKYEQFYYISELFKLHPEKLLDMFTINLKGIDKKIHDIAADTNQKLLSYPCAETWFVYNNKMYKIVDGKPRELNKDSTVELLGTLKECATSGVKEEHCNKFIKCITSKSMFKKGKECDDLFKNPNAFDIQYDKILKMAPRAAIAILYGFGFEFNVLGGSFYKVQDITEFHNAIMAGKNNRVTRQQYDDIIKRNDKLLSYLSQISLFINCNPGLFNKNNIPKISAEIPAKVVAVPVYGNIVHPPLVRPYKTLDLLKHRYQVYGGNLSNIMLSINKNNDEPHVSLHPVLENVQLSIAKEVLLEPQSENVYQSGGHYGARMIPYGVKKTNPSVLLEGLYRNYKQILANRQITLDETAETYFTTTLKKITDTMKEIETKLNALGLATQYIRKVGTVPDTPLTLTNIETMAANYNTSLRKAIRGEYSFINMLQQVMDSMNKENATVKIDTTKQYSH